MTPKQNQPVKRPNFGVPFSQSVGKKASCPPGFTLSELLIASAIMGVVIAVSSAGVLTMIQANDKAEEQSIRRIELNRALEFMADDIREATSISYTVPPGWTDNASAKYTPIFYLLKPSVGGTPTTVAYYIRSGSGVVWQSPRVIYRLEPTNGKPAKTADDDLNNKVFQNVGTKGSPLVDAVIASSPTCQPLSGTTDAGLPNVGLKVFIDANQQTAKVCMAGKLGKTDSISLETQVFARGRS